MFITLATGITYDTDLGIFEQNGDAINWIFERVASQVPVIVEQELCAESNFRTLIQSFDLGEYLLLEYYTYLNPPDSKYFMALDTDIFILELRKNG